MQYCNTDVDELVASDVRNRLHGQYVGAFWPLDILERHRRFNESRESLIEASKQWAFDVALNNNVFGCVLASEYGSALGCVKLKQECGTETSKGQYIMNSSTSYSKDAVEERW